MSITSLTQSRSGNTTTLSAVSNLTPPAPPSQIYFHWYIDGGYVGFTGSTTTTGTKAFVVAPTEQIHVDVLDTLDPAFDPVANAPAGYPSRRTLVWIRSVGASIASYRVEQQIGAGAWTALGSVADDARRWEFWFTTPELLDLTSYNFRVIPVDLYGNDGTPIVLGAETVVRTPDAPSFTVTFDQAHDQVAIGVGP